MTLLAVLQRAADRGMGVICATPFNAGILVTGPVEGAICNYRPATPDELARSTAGPCWHYLCGLILV